jgi:hypothetical protein
MSSTGDRSIGSVAQGTAGSSENPWWVRETNQSTASGGGSTAVDVVSMPAVTVSNPTTAVTVSNPTTAVNVANPTTAVTITNPTTLVTVSNPGGASPSSAAARTTANTSADVSLLAANANRKGGIIQNASTASALLLGLSTAVVSSAAYSMKIPLNGFFVIGVDMPNYTGPVRGRLESTALAGPAFVTELT